MPESTFWKMLVSFGGGALLSLQHIPQSKAVWYLFLVVLFDVAAGALAAKISDGEKFSTWKMSLGFISKFFGCLMMAATIFISEDVIKEQAHIIVNWSLTDYALAVMILWEGCSVARSYRKLNLPAATTIGAIMDGINDYLESRRPKLEAQKPADQTR